MSKPEEFLTQFLKENEADHFDFTPAVNYLVSTGSLKLDAALGGGFGPGVHRFGGASEGGKTSCALAVAKNFLATVPNSRVMIIKAEGRLSEKVKARSKIKFAPDAMAWHVGTAYIHKCNIFDTIANLIDQLIKNNDKDYKYLFIIDSMDGLILKEDMAKKIGDGDHVKVAGPNVLAKLLLKRTSLPCAELGHMIFMINQVIANIKASRFDKSSGQMDVGSGGGNALIHFSNFILKFLPKFYSDMITSDGERAEVDSDKVSNILGHNCKVVITKSENEQTFKQVTYPIRHGDGTNDMIWTEYELETYLTAWQLIEKKGAWYNFSLNMLKAMADGIDWYEAVDSRTNETTYSHAKPKVSKEDKDFVTVKKIPYAPIAEKFQGKRKFIEWISEPEIKSFWFNYFRNWMTNDDFL